ncbi:hypothetical protein [Chitinophaga nivalis]|uniref:Uncharacterized protein n=1 Tax=Chitinophaga nivalis TaxID=2991709 RepID=A0ABT3IHY7_9BACT|nr:hypothetical protein [Chitinophaga nivalis]MCW3466742.1 hypothetical protein [Chitinophaga nivalis]MCW3483567.1 hypothetical protein [Chitinophaga nivalis]
MLRIIEQLKTAKDADNVAAIITQVVANTNNGTLPNQTVTALQQHLEKVSPLDCESTEWRNYRHALMFLNKKTMLQPASA